MAKRKNTSGANLTHEEIWDDTALVRSWDEAVAEYNLYHSIHARGEDVDDVLNRAEKEGVEAVAADLEKLHDAMDVENVSETNAAQWDEKTEADDGQTQFQSQSAEGAMPPAETTAPSGSVPGALLGQVQDPALKNLMMAWYYAGYYTGLHEGRQQATKHGQVSLQKQ